MYENFYLILILSGLSLWRVSRMLVLEDGPFYIFQRFRVLIGIYEDEEGHTQSDNWIGTLFTCPMCVSVWLGFPLALGVWFYAYLWLGISGLFLLWWGLSGFSSALYRFTD